MSGFSKSTGMRGMDLSSLSDEELELLVSIAERVLSERRRRRIGGDFMAAKTLAEVDDAFGKYDYWTRYNS